MDCDLKNECEHEFMYHTENDHGPPYQPDEVEANDSKHEKGIDLHHSQKHMFGYTFNC